MSPICDEHDDDDNDNDLRDLAGRSHRPHRPTLQQQHHQHHHHHHHQQQQQQQQKEDYFHTRPSFLSPRAEKSKGKLKINLAGTLSLPQDTTNPHMSYKPSTTIAPLGGVVGKGPGGGVHLLSRRHHSFHPIASSSISRSASACSSSSFPSMEEEEDMVCGSYEAMSPIRQGTGGASRPFLTPISPIYPPSIDSLH